MYLPFSLTLFSKSHAMSKSGCITSGVLSTVYNGPSENQGIITILLETLRSLPSEGRFNTWPLKTMVLEPPPSRLYPSNGDVFFTGISKNGKLIGGKFYEKESLTQLNPQQGVSFLPILIKAGKPQPVPEEWQSTKQPRTIIGEYANGDFIMIVVDGRQSDWSSGVTLERLQNKLAELGVKEGYNLDGGGSSTMVFKGQVLNRPSDGKERKVSNNIVIMP
jgi:hypothetical protein